MEALKLTAQEVRDAMFALSESERVDIAEAVKRAEYWSDVRRIADDLRDEIKSGSVTDAEGADTWLHESIDGCSMVIYTTQAQDVIRYSDNSDAMIDEFGSDGLIRDECINWSGLAYCALMADVRETLGDIDDLFEHEEENDEKETA